MPCVWFLHQYMLARSVGHHEHIADVHTYFLQMVNYDRHRLARPRALRKRILKYDIFYSKIGACVDTKIWHGGRKKETTMKRESDWILEEGTILILFGGAGQLGHTKMTCFAIHMKDWNNPQQPETVISIPTFTTPPPLWRWPCQPHPLVHSLSSLPLTG
jgi:hypothetical protein